MKNFRSNDRGGRDERTGSNRGAFRPGGAFRGGDRGGDRGGRAGFDGPRAERGPITLHSAVCASCGKTCEVPFRPNGDKPVYCRDCFAGRSAMGGERSNRKDFRTEGRSEMKRDFNSPKPSYAGAPTPNTTGDLQKKMEAMTVKMDKLISSIHTLTLALTQNSPIAKAIEITTETPVAETSEEVAPKAKKVFKKVSKKSVK
ncbi:MAG: CxxC-x17-CxxC domain-containing protein [Patescibacteria group bacterium]